MARQEKQAALGLLIGLLKNFSGRQKEQHEQRGKIEQTEASASNQRLRLLVEAANTLAGPKAEAPPAPGLPTITEPERPLATTGGFRPRVETTATRGETLGRITDRAQQAGGREDFFERGSVTRLLSRLGIRPEQIQETIRQRQTFPERQRRFELGQQKRSQAQSMIDLLGFRSGQADEGDPIVRTGTDEATGKRVGQTLSGQVIFLE